jgi:biopolymer transport protein ExbB/TolQ
MDFRVYMLLIGLLIAIFAVIGYFVLSASFRSHERRRKFLSQH